MTRLVALAFFITGVLLEVDDGEDLDFADFANRVGRGVLPKGVVGIKPCGVRGSPRQQHTEPQEKGSSFIHVPRNDRYGRSSADSYYPNEG